MIRKGQQVPIKPEWPDAGDDQFIWNALEDEDGGRVRIMPLMPDLTYPPVTIVETKLMRESVTTKYCDP